MVSRLASAVSGLSSSPGWVCVSVSVSLHKTAGVFCRTPNANAKRRMLNTEYTICLWFSSSTHVCLRLVFVC